MTYDKKRITSTVILGIFLAIAIFVGIMFARISLTELKAENPEEAVGLVFAVLILVVFVFMAYGLIIIASAICLPFAIRNRRSTLKAVRIISYIYDAAFALLIVLSIVKIITFINS